MTLLASSVLALLSSTASAETLAWAWQPGQPVYYHAEVARETIDGDWYFGAENLEARATQVNLVTDMSCQATENLGKRWLMECRFYNVEISGTAFSTEEESLRLIFDEYEGYLVDSWASFEFTTIGRLRSFDLHAIDAHNERLGVVSESLRQLMLRPFGQLELELPKKGVAGAKPWKQGGTPVLTQLRSSYGTTGNVAIKHSLASQDGAMVDIETQGHGTVAYGLAVEADGTRTIAVDLVGAASFDTASGQLVRRESMVVGRFTAGSSYSNPADHFREIAAIERIAALPSSQAAPAPSAEPGQQPSEDGQEPTAD